MNLSSLSDINRQTGLTMHSSNGFRSRWAWVLRSNASERKYAKPCMIQDDGTADDSEFRLRPTRPDETGLPVNWPEAVGPGKRNQLDEVRRLFRLGRRRNGRFAEMNVGTILRDVSQDSETLRIVHDPLEATGEFETDPSHAEITGLPPADSDQAILVGDLIAERVIEMHPAVVGQES